jgi:hypothetical protein
MLINTTFTYFNYNKLSYIIKKNALSYKKDFKEIEKKLKKLYNN